jgi:hypothetical protein
MEDRIEPENANTDYFLCLHRQPFVLSCGTFLMDKLEILVQSNTFMIIKRTTTAGCSTSLFPL